jgi:hypothetical protein
MSMFLDLHCFDGEIIRMWYLLRTAAGEEKTVCLMIDTDKTGPGINKAQLEANGVDIHLALDFLSADLEDTHTVFVRRPHYHVLTRQAKELNRLDIISQFVNIVMEWLDAVQFVRR